MRNSEVKKCVGLEDSPHPKGNLNLDDSSTCRGQPPHAQYCPQMINTAYTCRSTVHVWCVFVAAIAVHFLEACILCLELIEKLEIHILHVYDVEGLTRFSTVS